MLICCPGTCDVRAGVCRQSTAMRYFFFLFVLLKESIISSLKLSGLQEQYSLFLSPPSCSPLQIPGLPASPWLFLRPMYRCSDMRPLGSSHGGWGPLFKVGCHHTAKDLFCSVFCFQPRTLEQRSQDQLTNRYKAKRQRDSDLEASHQKKMVSGWEDAP